MEIGFYHCTASAPADAAVQLAHRAWAAGERLLMVMAEELLDELDLRLWAEPPDSFLPHGLAREADLAALQPVLLASAVEPLNGARLLLLLDRPLPDPVAGFARVFRLFADGSEGHAMARREWKALAGRPDVVRRYWQQDARGRWAEKRRAARD
ncbi:MAG: DNA polymerase III subunit chi [Sphingomonadaceae bacterium]|uniref:DNA polymerase III subunit chi n=1 Tax=Thermaurantiacus sp. TaxID=2820283 RepID=UPI00298F10AD|nr:DNA polymerase III subunit chi [Thermaurantiacus sp.]MCS6986974.1 DNA polymerase III subunit chi [Sphingomonadaceae bacterium]MDW8415426.1 DNA polymerase III subunit chi [Thermaurantiacus sp.]